MSAMVNVSTQILRDGVELGRAAAALAEKVASDRQQIGAKIPLVVDALVSRGLLDSMEKSAIAQRLRDPVQAMDVLASVIKFAHPPTRMGEPVSRSNDSGVAGRFNSAADIAFLEAWRGQG